MQLELSKKEFRRLLDMVYIGNWILNSTRGEDRFRDYDQVESLLFEKARQEGMPILAETYRGETVPSRAFVEGGIHEAIMEYENNVFFDILAEDLARRDMNDAPIDETNCEELARGGANVVLRYAGRAEAAQETVTACEDLGAKALAVQCNVAEEAHGKALMDAAVKEFGRIDILVNNAGVTRDGLVMMMKEADFDAVIDTNLKGTFLCMKAVSRIMMKQRYGRIVNLSSVVGLRGNAGQVNYAASKAGVVGMTKSLAKELASRGVTVNAVAPGFIETDMTAAMPQAAKDAMMPTIPMQRLGAPEDVAKAVAFLASDEAAYVTGQVLAVDGGMAM